MKGRLLIAGRKATKPSSDAGFESFALSRVTYDSSSFGSGHRPDPFGLGAAVGTCFPQLPLRSVPVARHSFLEAQLLSWRIKYLLSKIRIS